MKDLKVVFMGTPIFSVPILENLIKNTNVVLVVTQKDAPVGRKKILTPCEVKKCALEHNINVFSPANIKEDYQIIKDLNPDVIITCAYGQIIPKAVLDIPKYKCINIHASLLPKYRGGAPIHRAIMDGETETGITLMYMDEKMDSGDALVQEKVEITKNDNIETLSLKLSNLGATMIIKYLEDIITGKIKGEKQDESKVTFAKIIKRADEQLNFLESATANFNRFRALSPSPLPYFILDEKEYKVAECEVTSETGTPNTIIKEEKDSITIACQENSLKITKIKPVGKNIMTIKEFKNGYKEKLLGKKVN